MGTIVIADLELSAVIGTLPEERLVPQRVLATIEVEANTAGPAAEDRLEEAVDYTALAERVRRCAVEGRFQLLETLAERAARAIQEEFAVGGVRLEVRKPGAIRGAAWAAVRVELPARKSGGHPADKRAEVVQPGMAK
jgi:dihydroneopterin aldolase